MLTQSQRAALTARLRQGRAAAPAPIPRRASGQDDNLPLSFAQEQLWFIDKFAPGQPTYNVPQALRLTGPVSPAALAGALSSLAARHEVLRTRLVTGRYGNPVQVVDEPAPVRLGLVDLAALDGPGRLAGLREFIDAESIRPFSLADGPLLRADLITLACDDHVLLLNFHHTVFDGWSAGVLVSELAALYRQQATGEPAELAELPVQYADFALAERGRLHGAAVAQLEQYWREALAGAPTLRFPADRLRPAVEDFAGGLAELTTSPELLDRLRELGRRQGATLFATLLAGLAALLVRYTGQDDLVIGTVTANRGRPELAPLIGFLVNTLPIRVDASGDPPFAELLGRVRAATIAAYAHQDLPFAKIVAAAHVARDPSRAPLFQIALTFAERDTRPVHAAGVDFVLTDLIAGVKSAKFDLDFTAESRSEGLWIECSYKTALFDAEKMRRLLTHLEVLLGGAVENPFAPISRLPLLTAAEVAAELADSTGTAASYPRVCVHEGFERQVALTPDAVAAEYEAEQISYADLNRRADEIAGRLRGSGAGPETLVGVCMRTGIDRLAALLGIWKAGGGYVPLDPSLPAERLGYMITDTAMKLIVTDQDSAPALPDTTARIVTLSPISSVLARGDDPPEPPEHPELSTPGRADPGQVAYVIYTSGSTGQPKGVVVEHRHAANFLYGMIDTWRVGPADRVLQFASLNFDASVQEMFMPLLAGGRVVLAPPDALHTPRRLRSLIRDRGVTFAVLTPSVVRFLRDEQFPDLRVLMCGGEEMPSDLVATWLRPGLSFVNDYGPTETSVTAVFTVLDQATPLPPPIGLPSPNYQAHVLDRHLNPVPPGVPGELHIGGAGVARGYLGRPALTSERFVPDPFLAGGRMYKTGDLCYRRGDGSIVFAGRTDHQVKLRGLRIELGEIEAALAACPGIAQAVVTVTSHPAGDADLVGYLRPASGQSPPDAADVRDHLATSLPGYMIPGHLITVDDFPLNASGKIDRDALPAPLVRPTRPATSVPVTATESALAGLFADVLHRADVGATDNFFECGGNSLLVMRLIDVIATHIHADLTPVAVFLHPTPRELAAHIDLPPHIGTDLIPLTSGSGGAAGSARPALVLVHPIGGVVTDYTALAAELTSTSAVYGLQAPGLTSGSSTPASLTALVAHYTDLIRSVQPDGPYRLGGWSMGGVLAYEITRRIERDGGTTSQLVLLDPPYAVEVADGLTKAVVAGQFVADVTASLHHEQNDGPDPTTTDPAEQLRWLAGQLGADGLAEQLTRRFEVFARHTDLLAGYRPARDGAVNAPTLLITAARSLNAQAGPRWRKHLLGPVDTLVLDSDHYEFLRPPLVSKVAAAIGAARGEQ